jgi:hypothetical protein
VSSYSPGILGKRSQVVQRRPHPHHWFLSHSPLYKYLYMIATVVRSQAPDDRSDACRPQNTAATRWGTR